MILENPVRLLHRADGRMVKSNIAIAYVPEEECVYFRQIIMGDGKHGLLADKYFESHKDEILLLVEVSLLNAGVDLPHVYRYRGVILSDSYAKIDVEVRKIT